MEYVYPAVFTREENGVSVKFPDIDGCFTSGKTMSEAIFMAQDALNLMLMFNEDEGVEVGSPSNPKDIQCAENQIVSLVRADTTEYRKMYGKQAVKKTLSIPAWLNTEAEKKGINFSSVLQAALKSALDIA